MDVRNYTASDLLRCEEEQLRRLQGSMSAAEVAEMAERVRWYQREVKLDARVAAMRRVRTIRPTRRVTIRPTTARRTVRAARRARVSRAPSSTREGPEPPADGRSVARAA